MNQKDPLVEANQRFLEYRAAIDREMNMVNNFEELLQKLGCIDRDTRLIYLDWPDHMEYVWQKYSDRVRKHEEKDSTKTE